MYGVRTRSCEPLVVSKSGRKEVKGITKVQLVSRTMASSRTRIPGYGVLGIRKTGSTFRLNVLFHCRSITGHKVGVVTMGDVTTTSSHFFVSESEDLRQEERALVEPNLLWVYSS